MPTHALCECSKQHGEQPIDANDQQVADSVLSAGSLLKAPAGIDNVGKNGGKNERYPVGGNGGPGPPFNGCNGCDEVQQGGGNSGGGEAQDLL
jgi:hypothetical protein